MNACFTQVRGLDGVDAACRGYGEAAHALLDHVITGRGTIDTVVYPIVFNWRHHLELRLKIIIVIGATLFEDREPRIPGHHDLYRLWRDARGYITRTWRDEDDAALREVDVHLAEMARVDGNSYVFQYTVDKQGFRALPVDLEHLGLVEFRDATMEVARLLERVAVGLGAALYAEASDFERQAKAETDAELRSACPAWAGDDEQLW